MNENASNENRDENTDEALDETRPLGAEPSPDAENVDESPEEPGYDRTGYEVIGYEAIGYDEHDYDETGYDRSAPLSTMLTANGVEEPTGRTHPLSVGYLVCGLVFLGIAASWALRQAGIIDADGEQWVLPLVLVVAGGAGLLALVARGMFGSKA